MLVLSLRVTRQLDHNPLLEVDEDIAVHGQLEVLYLHNTRIRRLNDSASYLYRLRELWISDTAITRLDPGPWVRNITCHMLPGQSSRAVSHSPRIVSSESTPGADDRADRQLRRASAIARMGGCTTRARAFARARSRSRIRVNDPTAAPSRRAVRCGRAVEAAGPEEAGAVARGPARQLRGPAPPPQGPRLDLPHPRPGPSRRPLRPAPPNTARGPTVIPGPLPPLGFSAAR